MSQQPTGEVCECGHPMEAHELVEGFDCSPGVTINGATSVPDVLVCTGACLVEVTEGRSPWASVCACVLPVSEEARP